VGSQDVDGASLFQSGVPQGGRRQGGEAMAPPGSGSAEGRGWS
jgi:hypothetical protein